MKFSVVSVDCQHALWNVPTAKNGREYIEFLDKRFIKKYLSYADNVSWNCDLGGTIRKYVPKSATQEKRDHTKKELKDFLQSRLLGEVNIISDTYVAEDWSTIICDRKNRNQIAKYVGGNFSFLKLPECKTVIVNSEAVMNGNHAVPQLYQNKNKIITRINALDMLNTYCEGEGAAVGFIVCNHLQENVMVVFKYIDTLFYCMIDANKRDRVSHEFSHEFWLEILCTTNPAGLTGSKNNSVSEYWNINELIYSIEHLLPNIGNPVLSLIVLYLSAGSELTEKWFGKTHATFIKKYMAHSDFIGDLINSRNIRTLNSNSYRNLNNCLDCRKH